MKNRFVRAMAAGFVATIALSMLMVLKAMMGLMPKLNAPRMLAEMGHQMLGLPLSPAIGWIGHFLIGTVLWGALFAALQDVLPGGGVQKGLVFSTGAWLMMLVVMPMADAGVFGLKLGLMAPVATLVLHFVYGAVLGAVDRALVR